MRIIATPLVVGAGLALTSDDQELTIMLRPGDVKTISDRMRHAKSIRHAIALGLITVQMDGDVSDNYQADHSDFVAQVELNAIWAVISGASGFGQSGFSGFSGIGTGGGVGSGESGYSGYSGVSGFSGTFSGAQGASGESGQSGSSGFSGHSGQSGFSGLSGWSGVSIPGSPGTSGFSGYSGFTGFSGFSSQSGISGFSGSGISAGSILNLEMEMEFKTASLLYYKTFSYTGVRLDTYNIYTNSGLGVQLFSKTLTYGGAILNQTVLTRISDSATLTCTYAYTGSNLTSITRT